MARIVWYFDFVSPFSYLQFAARPELFRRADVDMKPVVFAGLLNRWGQKGPAEIEPKRIHTYRLCQWQANRRNIPMRFPPEHPFNPIHALRLSIAFGSTYDTVKSIFDFIWAQGRSPNDEWKALCDTLGVPGAEVLSASEGVKSELRENGEAATAAGVFGVPTFVVDGNLFWGIDATAMLHDYLNNGELFETDEMKRLSYLPSGASR